MSYKHFRFLKGIMKKKNYFRPCSIFFGGGGEIYSWLNPQTLKYEYT